MQNNSTRINISSSVRFILALIFILVLSVGGFYIILRPPLDEVWLISGFLLITTVISAVAGYAAYRLGWMNRSPNIRTAFLGSYALASILTFFNVWLTARLMFTDEHDLLLGTILLLFAGAIAMALGYLLSSSFLDRISSLDQAAKKIANGNLSIRVPVEGRDELADLSETFNQMASQLQDAADKRMQLESLRKELIAWIGHDLQTPLASISAIIEALADGMVEDPATEMRYLQTAKKNIAALSHLIDDLFQMAQIDAGGLRLNFSSVTMSDLISDILVSFSQRAEKEGVIIRGSVDPDLEMVQMDIQRISRVLNNLVDNAIRHSPEGGIVEIHANRSGRFALVEVVDNGEGIPNEDLPNIFDLFYRGKKKRYESNGSAGLGLPISKGIVEAHGGIIDVQSEPGRTRFSFKIPLER
jgi:signal transduction histidine kinase